MASNLLLALASKLLRQIDQVADLLDSINSKLGMSPAACQRFRYLWRRARTAPFVAMPELLRS